MALEQLFEQAGAQGLQLGNMFQTSYVKGKETRTDAWSAHFHDDKGQWRKGFGRTAYAAVADALKQSNTLSVVTDLTDEEMELM